MALKRKVAVVDLTAEGEGGEGQKRGNDAHEPAAAGSSRQRSTAQIESRGTCRLCGEQVTTVDLRYKEHGAYVHAACRGKRAPARPLAAGTGAGMAVVAVEGIERDSEQGERHRRGNRAEDVSGPGGTAKGKEPAAIADSPKAARELSIYDKPPEGNLSLLEFEQFALDRMRVLNTVSACKAQGAGPMEVETAIDKTCRAYLPLRKNSPEREEDMRKDEVSHYILRMAFSRSAELRRWFLRQEETLFKHRFNALDSDGRAHAMRMLNSGHGRKSSGALSPVSEDEFCQIEEQLMLVFGDSTVGSRGEACRLREARLPWSHMYKVEFEQVADLVARRRVFLKKGVAYLISPDLVSVAASAFRERLLESLQEHSRAFATRLEDEGDRLGPLLQKLVAQRVCQAPSAVTSTSSLTLDELPAALEQSAPLCMRNTFQALVDNQHLKHDARRQLTLFLKGVGVSMADCLAFWRRHLKLKAPEFDKRYAYNIRHLYGAEGKRFDYAPFSCHDLIHSRQGLSAPLADCAHGCPFKEFGASRLTSALTCMHLELSVVQRAVQQAASKQYQAACSQVFLALHPAARASSSGGSGHGSALGEGLVHAAHEAHVVHPNQYWLSSRSNRLSPHLPASPSQPRPGSLASVVQEEEVAAAEEEEDEEDEDDAEMGI